MGTSLSSAILSWLPCKSGLQQECSGSLQVRKWEDFFICPPELSCWKDVTKGLSRYSAGRVCPQSQVITDLLPSSRKLSLYSKGCPRKLVSTLWRILTHWDWFENLKSMAWCIQVQSFFAPQTGLHPLLGPSIPSSPFLVNNQNLEFFPYLSLHLWLVHCKKCHSANFSFLWTWVWLKINMNFTFKFCKWKNNVVNTVHTTAVNLTERHK